MTIFFQNRGQIDLDVIRTMGVSVKETGNPIGFFGTGLKFAIATLLRTGHKITLECGGDLIEFHTVKKSIRGKDFDMIMMGDEQLAFTTELGKNWHVWQAYRELHANTLDENGHISRNPREYAEDSTTFMISGEEIEQVFDERFKIFLASDPSWVVDGLEIHRGQSSYLYYRGVRVHQLPKPTAFTYNFTMPMQLTEDRTLVSAYDAQWKIGNRAPMVPDPEFARRILNPEYQGYESGVDYSNCYEPSEEFLNVIEEFRDHAKLNSHAKELLKSKRKLKPTRDACQLSVQEIMTVQEAIALLPGVNCNAKFEDVIFVEFLGQNVEGAMEDGQIYIARSCIAKGVQWVASTIYEEWIHKQLGYQDETRAMQQFLFDKIFQLVKELKK
jgi:hypothetical protein